MVAAAALVKGFALEAAGLAWTNLLQERVRPDKLGRVTSIDSLGSYALLPAGYALAGWATDRVGPSSVFLAAGLTTFAVAAFGLVRGSARESS